MSNKMQGKRNILSYLAGFFDGEGCVHISNAHRSIGHGSLTLRIAVVQKSRLPLNLFLCHFGGSIRWNPISESWRWQISCRKALYFLIDIEPYLFLKAPQARVGIEFQNAKMNRRGIGRKGLSAKTWAVEEAQRILLHTMKKVEVEV